MKKAVTLISLLSTTHLALAADLVGVIRDERGNPIEAADVELVGTTIKVKSNDQGRFTIPGASGKALEFHIKAPGFAHRIFHSAADQNAPLDIVLDSSVLDVVNVVGLPWHASNIESAQPITVLSDEKLRSRQASTLGDTLKQEAGVHSNYYGPVASSPIIRGLEGSRVLIAQNGLDAGDASRVGPDHVVATEASTARQIEILRGPATLFYGSGAIGGVVNVVDDRVPQSTATRGEWRLEHNSVVNEKLASGSVTSGGENVAVHVDGFWRDSDDYRIPGSAERGADRHGSKLENSAYDAQGFNLGSSYILENGFAGVSIGRLERTYGIPGHSHGAEDVPVHADLKQDRVQFISELTLDSAFISRINNRIGYTDYAHNEIELGATVTRFTNESYEARTDFFHQPLMDWRGAVTLHYKRSDFSALGSEAFMPPSLTESWALALIEERHFGSLLVQLGGRIEQVDISADDLVIDTGRYDDAFLSSYSVDHRSTPYSLAAGTVWEFTSGYNLAVSLTHAQRTPAASELLSYGAHIGSGLFEVGSLIGIRQDSDSSVQAALQRNDTQLETSQNIDISLRKFNGDFGFITNIFYNRIDDYYYQTNTGLTQSVGHQHDDHVHFFDLPVYAYQARDAAFYGMEGEFTWQMDDPLKVTLVTDYIRGELRDGGNLPRIPPMRLGARINYQLDKLAIELSTTHYFRQNDTAELETRTDGYTLLDLQLSYDIDSWIANTSVYLKGQNLTDEYARVHSSFLKDKAPLPGRSVTAGISGTF